MQLKSGRYPTLGYKTGPASLLVSGLESNQLMRQRLTLTSAPLHFLTVSGLSRLSPHYRQGLSRPPSFGKSEQLSLFSLRWRKMKREQDSNLRPPSNEPGELPTALSRVKLLSFYSRSGASCGASAFCLYTSSRGVSLISLISGELAYFGIMYLTFGLDLNPALMAGRESSFLNP